MGRAAGLTLPATELLPAKAAAPYFAIRRFDRIDGTRLHCHTLAGLLHADHTLPALDYDHLLRVTGALTRDEGQVTEAFRRACFNVFAHNRDDHGKQFTFTMTAEGEWNLAPAYDLTFSEGPGGEHSTTVEGEGRAPGVQHLLKLAARHTVRRPEEVVEQVRVAVGDWTSYANSAGVSAASKQRIRSRIAPG